MKFLGSLLAGLLTTVSWGQVVRHYLAYGDSNLVSLARTSGHDPNAAIGLEIPAGVSLLIPTARSTFVVQQCIQYTEGTRPIFPGGYVSMLCYDRTFGYAMQRNPALVNESFRKLAPAYSNVRANFGNFPSYLGYDYDGTVIDADGIPGQDTAYMGLNPVQEPYATCSYGPGQSLRSLGLRGILSGWTPQAFCSWRMDPGDSFRICDISLKSSMAAGELYGNGVGETGLLLPTDDPSEDQGAAYVYNHFGIAHQIGAKYVVEAVPEPNALAVLGLGAGWLLKPRVNKPKG